MKLNAIQPLPEAVHQHEAIGGRDLRCYRGIVSDGQLWVTMGLDPFPDGMKHHISASVGVPGDKRPFRAPTDKELRMVVETIAPSLAFRETLSNLGPSMFRHLVEIKEPS